MDILQNRDKFSQEYEKALKETLFPVEKINDDVIGVSFAVFNCKSIAELGLTAQGLEDLFKALAAEKISLYQMSFIINGVPQCSPKDLGVTTSEYIRICKLNDEMGKVWNETQAPVKNTLVDRLNREAAKLDKKNNSVNPLNRQR